MWTSHSAPAFCKAAALALAMAQLSLAAEDKSGVGPNVISLPKGPGSIEGLGEAFQPSLNTGTGKHALKIAVSPGTAGHAPELALVYDGGGGNGIVGMGWSLPMAFVQRQTDKGVPRYVDGPNGIDDDLDSNTDEADEVDHFINGASEELVPVQDGAVVSFFSKNEGSFMRYRRIGAYWEARTPDGSLLIFGQSASARLVDPADPSHVFRWLLEKEIDTHGNTIRYRYATSPGATNAGQIYLQAVEYGPGAPGWEGKFHFVWFDFEDRTDWFEDCSAGFAVRTGKRLREMVVGTQGVTLANHAAGDFNHDGTPDALNRIYRLGYQAGLPRSLLANVTQIGMDGVSSLPPASYGYTQCSEPATIAAAGGLIVSLNAPPVVFDQTTVDFTDLNGDGLPDLLRTSTVGGPHQVYFNQGETTAGGSPAIQWSSPEDVATTPGVGDPWNLGLEQNQTVLSDVDGDGLSDLVQMTPFDTYYFPCKPPLDGSAQWGARQALGSVDFIPPSPFGSGGSVKTMDVNFDKRTDIVRSTPVGGGFAYQVWFNLADDTFSQRATFNPATGYDFSSQAVQLADLNGDRMQDVAWVRPTQVLFTASLGIGRFQEEETIPIPDETLTTEQIGKAALRDVNGDGLADLVVDRPVPQTLWIWFNRGNRTLSSRCIVTGLPASFSSATAVRWVDVNGNGTTDMVIGDSGLDAGERIQTVDIGRLFGCVPRPWLLNRIENGIGRVETLLYDTSTTFALQDGTGPTGYRYLWSHPLPFPVEVVKEIRTSDSLGNQYVTRFRYHDGFYDPEEKQFRGFARVEQIDVGDATAPTLESRFTFDVGAVSEVMKGKMLRQVAATEAGEVFTDSATIWNIKNLHAGLDGRSVDFAHAQLSTSDILERGVGIPRRIETEFDYDDYGNEIERREYGVVEGVNRAAFNDERVTATQYALNLSSWMLRYPKRREIRSLAGAVFVRRDSFYDDESFGGGNFGQVSVGNLTMVRDWPDPSKPAEFLTTSRTRFDVYGNPVDLLDPLYGQQAGHWRQIGFDADFHSFPESETIHTAGTSASLQYSAAYDKGLGVLTSASDFNTNETTFSYDPLARLTRIVKPGDSAQFPTETYSYHLAQTIVGVGLLNWIETKKRETAGGGTFDCRVYVDALGRTLQSTCEGAEPGEFVVSGATTFNERKQRTRAYLPYFSSSLEFSPPSPASAAYSDFLFDATLRSTEVINPPESTSGPRRSSRTVYEPLLTRLFDEEDNTPASPHHDTPHVQYKDGLGRLVGVDEINNENGTPATYPTRYRYDLNDQLIGITDSQNNVKSMLYDGLKRITFMHDPDRGVMEYTYDDASNLKETIDAKGQHITMTYDGANRIQTEDYLDAAGHTPDVTYFYDTPNTVPAGDGTSVTSTQVKGKLSSVTDLSGAEHFSYDARGRTAWKIKRIPDPRTGVLASFMSGFSYDSLDRLTHLQYPDGDTAGYGYNARNLPQTITGGPSGFIISGMTYKASGQLDTTTYGNGVGTSYQYDPRLRLRSLNTAKDATQLISFAYQFDAASNITRIDDNRAAIPNSDPRKNTQVFGYDDLYRLTSVQYPALLSGSAGSIAYAYDRIGNMLSQGSNITATENGLPLTNLGTMSYGGTAGPSGRIGRSAGQPGPHALTAVSGGSRSYPYDANGNMETIDGMTCTWDFKDRLIAVENATMRADYTYDYTDRRITKRVLSKSPPLPISPSPPEHTIYVDRTYELRPSGEPTKYVWNGETRVARVTTNLNATQRLQRFTLHPGWNLCTLAVALTNAGTQLSTAPVQNVYRYDAATQTYHSIAGNEALPAGTLLRVRASAVGELAVRGTPAAAASVNYYPAGRHWIGNATFQPLDLATALAAEAPLWFWQASTQAWRYRLPSALSTASDAPARLEPGEAIFALHTAAFTLAPAEPNLEVRYYHQDHLGSSSVMTDATGQLVSESTFYPFGHPRNEHEPRNVKEVYGFTQKERDQESGLNYFEARYLNTSAGIYASVDNLSRHGFAEMISYPQYSNPYRHCLGNPLKYSDPDGNLAFVALIPLIKAAAIGAGAGATLNVISQKIEQHFDSAKQFSWREFGIDTAFGAVTGGAGKWLEGSLKSASLAVRLGAPSAMTGLSSFLQSVAKDATNASKNCIDWGKAASDSVFSAVTSFAVAKNMNFKGQYNKLINQLKEQGIDKLDNSGMQAINELRREFTELSKYKDSVSAMGEVFFGTAKSFVGSLFESLKKDGTEMQQSQPEQK